MIVAPVCRTILNTFATTFDCSAIEDAFCLIYDDVAGVDKVVVAKVVVVVDWVVVVEVSVSEAPISSWIPPKLSYLAWLTLDSIKMMQRKSAFEDDRGDRSRNIMSEPETFTLPELKFLSTT